MECSNCKCINLTKLVLVSFPGGKVKALKEISKNHYEKDSEKEIFAYVCDQCGHIDFYSNNIK